MNSLLPVSKCIRNDDKTCSETSCKVHAHVPNRESSGAKGRRVGRRRWVGTGIVWSSSGWDHGCRWRRVGARVGEVSGRRRLRVHVLVVKYTAYDGPNLTS